MTVKSILVYLIILSCILISGCTSRNYAGSARTEISKTPIEDTIKNNSLSIKNISIDNGKFSGQLMVSQSYKSRHTADELAQYNITASCFGSLLEGSEKEMGLAVTVLAAPLLFIAIGPVCLITDDPIIDYEYEKTGRLAIDEIVEVNDEVSPISKPFYITVYGDGQGNKANTLTKVDTLNVTPNEQGNFRIPLANVLETLEKRPQTASLNINFEDVNYKSKLNRGDLKKLRINKLDWQMQEVPMSQLVTSYRSKFNEALNLKQLKKATALAEDLNKITGYSSHPKYQQAIKELDNLKYQLAEERRLNKEREMAELARQQQENERRRQLNLKVGKSHTKTSSKWFAVSEANKDLIKQCGQNKRLTNITYDAKFSGNAKGWVATVSGECGNFSKEEYMVYWSYDFQQNDPNTRYRADQWKGKISNNIAPNTCKRRNGRVGSLALLSNNNSIDAGQDEFVNIFGSGRLGYQWLMFKLTCLN